MIRGARRTGRGEGSAPAFALGLVDSLLFAPAVFLWAAAFGAAAMLTGVGGAGALAMSAIVWSGAAQMAAIGAVGQPLLVVFATCLLLSLRFVPMSLVVAARLGGRPRWRRVVAACMVADTSVGMLTARPRVDAATYLAGQWVSQYATWVAGTAAGVVAARFLPAQLTALTDGLIGAIFAILAVQACDDRRGTLVAVGALVAVAALVWFLPSSLALLAGACGAAALGALGRSRQ